MIGDPDGDVGVGDVIIGDGAAQNLAQVVINDGITQGPQDGVQQMIQSLQDKQIEMMAEVQTSQSKMRRELEDAICQGLQGITEIRYGTQAKEYHQETVKQNDQLKMEVVEKMTNLEEQHSQDIQQTKRMMIKMEQSITRTMTDVAESNGKELEGVKEHMMFFGHTVSKL